MDYTTHLACEDATCITLSTGTCTHTHRNFDTNASRRIFVHKSLDTQVPPHMDVSHTQMPCHADLLHTEISTHRRFSTQKFGTLMFLHNETCFHTGAFPYSSWYRQKSCTHTATCTNRKFLNTEISPIDVSTRRHFAQRHFCAQQLLHPDILLHRCFCPLQDFTCKKKCFYRQMCSFSEAPHTEVETMRGRKSCDGTGCVYFSRVCVRFFFQRSCAKIAQI